MISDFHRLRLLLMLLLLVTQFVSLQLHAFIECTFLIPWLSRGLFRLCEGSLTLRGYFLLLFLSSSLCLELFSCVSSCLRRFSREICCFSLTHLFDALLSFHFSGGFIHLTTCYNPRVIMSWLVIRLMGGKTNENPRKRAEIKLNQSALNKSIKALS